MNNAARVVSNDYPLHNRSEVDIDVDAASLFAHLDDHRRLVGHMEKPSLMMAGAVMQVETDALEGQAVGSVIRNALYDRCAMFSKWLMLGSLACVWSCSDDQRAGANVGGAGSESAGSAGRGQAGASASGSGGQAGGSAAGHGGSATGGTLMGGAADVAGGGSNLGGASVGGMGGAMADAGGGAAGSDENPYGACLGEDATDNSCPLPGSVCHADFGCQPPCPTGTVSCPKPPAGGTASPYCQQRLCRLDCGFGKTCPAGMACDTANAFCTSNGL